MPSVAMDNVAVPQGGSKAVETRLLRRGYETEVARCCPIALQQARKVPAPPQRAAQKRKEPGKAVTPAMHKGQKAQPFRQAQGPEPAEGRQR